MPKRKNDNLELIMAKIRKLERKICRRGKRRRISSSSDPPDVSENQSSDGSQIEDRYTRRSESTTHDENNIAVESTSVQQPIIEASGPAASVSSGAAASSAAEPQSQPPPPPEPQSQPPPPPPEPCVSEPAVTSAPAPVDDSSALAEIESAALQLDDEILQILGEDPTKAKTYGTEIHKDLAVRLEHYVTNGLTKENRKELKEKYLLPSNCKLLDAPALNPEIKAAISDIVAKRDKAIEVRQKQIGAVISSMSQGITRLLNSTEKQPELLQTLMDATRLLCDSQHSDSITRRNFILSALKKDLKEQLTETKLDNTLFGQSLAETLKAAKAIHKSGAELKATPAPKSQNVAKKPAAGTSKNWKSTQSTFRKNPDPPKTKEPQPPSTRTRQSSSSKTSQQRTTRSRR